MISAYDAGKQEIGLDIVPGLMPSGYVEGRLDARLGKRPKKLQCKPGFEQRGAACQKITSKVNAAKPSPKKGGIGGAIATVAVAASAAAVGAAAMRASDRSRQQDKPSIPSLDPIIKPANNKKALLAVGAGGVALGTAATLSVAHRQRQEAVSAARSEAQAEVAAVQKKAKSDLEATTKELEAKHGAELSDARGKLSQTETKLGEREKLLEKTAIESTQIRSELEQAKTSVKTVRDELTKAKSEAQKYQSELDKTKKQLAEQGKSSEEKDAEISKKTEAVAKYEQDLKSTTKKIEELTEKSSTLESQVESLKKEVDATKGDRDKISADLDKLQKEADERVRQGVEREKSRLESIQKQKIAEIDDKHAARTAQAIASVQKDVEARIEAAKDPNPGAGFQKGRGDLIANNEGIKLGASARKGSDFLSRPVEDQHVKLANKASKTIDDIYTEKLKVLERDFAETVQDIDKNFPNQVDKVSNANLDPKTKPAELEKAAKSAARPESDMEKLYKKQYEKQPKEGGKAESEGDRKARVQGQLVKLGYLEKTTTKHRLRERALNYATQEIKTEIREDYRSALQELHDSAKDEFGNYVPSRVSPEALKKFDEKAKNIQKKAEAKLTEATNRVISANFAKNLAEATASYIDDLPDADVQKLLRGDSGDRQVSTDYLAGKIAVSLGLRKSYQKGAR